MGHTTACPSVVAGRSVDGGPTSCCSLALLTECMAGHHVGQVGGGGGHQRELHDSESSTFP